MPTLVFPINTLIKIVATPPIPLVGAMTMSPPTAPSTVVFTPGQLRWTAWEHGLRTARAVAMAKPARRPIRYAVLALRNGTCLRKGNGIRCLPQSAGNRRRARCSSPQAAGMIIRGGGTATGRTPTLSRRCLLATGATMGVPTARATTRTSGVLLRAIATTRTTCT